MENSKTYLLENDGLLTDAVKNWVESFDKNYKEINTTSRDYNRRQDLHFFALLINPNLERLMTSSAFHTIMDYSAEVSFGKKRKKLDDTPFMQLEYFSWLIYEAVRFRKNLSLSPIIIDINYEGINFLSDVNANKLGGDVKLYLQMMFKQNMGDIILNIYDDFKLVKTINNINDLSFS